MRIVSGLICDRYGELSADTIVNYSRGWSTVCYFFLFHFFFFFFWKIKFQTVREPWFFPRVSLAFLSRFTNSLGVTKNDPTASIDRIALNYFSLTLRHSRRARVSSVNLVSFLAIALTERTLYSANNIPCVNKICSIDRCVRCSRNIVDERRVFPFLFFQFFFHSFSFFFFFFFFFFFCIVQ